MSFFDIHGSLSTDPKVKELQEVLKSAPYPCQPYNPNFYNEEDCSAIRRYRSLTGALYQASAYLYPRRYLFEGEQSLAWQFLQQRIVAILPREEELFLTHHGRKEKEKQSNTAASSSAAVMSRRLLVSEDREKKSPLDLHRCPQDSDDEIIDEGLAPEAQGDEDMLLQRSSNRTMTIGQGKDLVQSAFYLEIKRQGLVEHAVITIQLWFRSRLAARLAVLLMHLAPMDYFSSRPWGDGYSKKHRKRVNAFLSIFTILSISYLKGERSRRDYLSHSRGRMIKEIVDEVVEQAIHIVQRERLAFELAANMLQTMAMGSASDAAALAAAVYGVAPSIMPPGGGGNGGGQLSPIANPGTGGNYNGGVYSPPPKVKKTLSSRIFSFTSSGNRASSPMPLPAVSMPVVAESDPTRSLSTGLEDESAGEGGTQQKSQKSFTRYVMGGFMG